MINLLSTERKGEIRAARTNVILTRYITIVTLALLFILGFSYFSYMTLEQTKQSAEERIASNASSPTNTQAEQEAALLASKIAATKTALSQQMSYAKLLTFIGQSLPEGAYLENLQVSQQEINNGQPLTLTILAKSQAEATTAQQQLQASGIFTQVTVQSTEASGGTDTHPLELTLRATINRSGV